MRVLIAPDRFRGRTTAAAASSAIAQGWLRHAPDDDLDLCPLSDGGVGFVDVLTAATPARTPAAIARTLAVKVTGPRGGSVPASLALGTAPDGVTTAYVESSHVVGSGLGSRSDDPERATTVGVGQLLRAARAAGASRIVVGLGPTVTHDAGAGLLSCLAAPDPAGSRPGPPGGTGADARFTRGGAGLRGVGPGEVAWIVDLRERWADVDLVIASDSELPLLGLHGASAVLSDVRARSGGAVTPARSQELERCLGDFAAAALDVLGLDRRAGTGPGTGAGGGLGFGLSLLGARRVGGAEAVFEAVGFAERLARSDLVITGEESFAPTSLRGSVVASVARAASAVGVPVVVLAGRVDMGRREAAAAGIAGTYALGSSYGPAPEETGAAAGTTAPPDEALLLRARAERVARTWSPSRA